MFKELLSSFASNYPSLRKLPFTSNEQTRVLTEEIPQGLIHLASISKNYKVYGSCGKGNWSEIPWIGILDTSITKSTEKGYYVVFLYSSDLSRLNLSLAIGWEQYEKEYGLREGRIRIEQAVNSLKSILHSPLNDFSFNRLDLGATLTLGKGYESGVVCHKQYLINNLPPDSDIVNDTRNIMGVYRELKGLVGTDILNLKINEDVQIESDFEKEVIKKSDQVRTPEEARLAINDLTSRITHAPAAQKIRMARYIERNHKLAELVKQAANFTCQICGMPPFRTKNGGFYAEAHHVLELAESRLDLPENMICICAQCHKIATYGTPEELQLRKNLFSTPMGIAGQTQHSPAL